MCVIFKDSVDGEWCNPYSYVCVQVHVRGRVRESTVQCTINGGEGGRDGELKRNEEVRGDSEASLSNSKKILLWLERYKMNVKAREHGLSHTGCITWIPRRSLDASQKWR